MRFIAILLALLIVGLLAYKQVEPRSDNQAQEAQEGSDPNVPKVPTNPDEVNQFGAQINDYMNEEAAKRSTAIDAAGAQ